MDKSRFQMREATKDDVPAMVEVFFHSFNAAFWAYTFPENAYNRQWFHDAFAIGIDNPTDKNFVITDSQNGGKVAAFSRWQVPQPDGNQERKWPDMKEDEYDMEIIEKFFGGMEVNRAELMGKRPHWFLELLGTHEDYQKRGLGSELIHWGTLQADRDGLETYLDGSEKGQPFYKAHHGFHFARDIDIPDRPEAYGQFHYVSMVRPTRKGP